MPPVPIVAPGWGTAFRSAVLCTLTTTIGLIAGIMLGVKLGLYSAQSLAIGAGLGYLLGWQSSAATLRRAGLTFGRALRVPMLPAAFVLIALIGGMAAAFQITGMAPEAITDLQSRTFWLIVGGSGVIGALLAAAKTRNALRH